jgi:soluble lytic murein transglycosylase-like protein
MIESVHDIYSRIKFLQDNARNLNSFKPDRVKEFEEMMMKLNKSNNDVTLKTKDNDIHPLLKSEKVEKKELIDTDNKASIDQAIKMASKRYNVSEDLIRAVIRTESNYDPHAVSRAGAMGLMQLMPRTMLELGVQKPFDIYQNIDGGVRYLKMMLERYDGDLDKSLAAYNAGPDLVDRVNGIPDIEETKNYVAKIKKYLY